MNKFRSHNCGELSLKNDGNVVHLSGWVNKKETTVVYYLLI